MNHERFERLILADRPLTAEELEQVVDRGDAIVLAAHEEGRHLDFFRVDERQLRAHVDVGAGRHRVVERKDRVGEGLDGRLICGAGMVAVEDAVHESAIDRPAVLRLELGQALPALGERRAAVTRPDEGVERQARDALGMALGEERRLQCARRDAVHQHRLADVLRGGRDVIRAVGDVEIDRPGLVRAPVALVVHRPGLEPLLGKPFHRGRMRSPGHLQIEGRLRGHR